MNYFTDLPSELLVRNALTLLFSVHNLQITLALALVTPLLRGYASLFQDVRLDVAAGHLALHVEVNADEFPESGAVIVAGRLGVSKRLQDRVRLHDLVLERRLLRLLLALPGADHGEVRDDLLRVLRLPGARLSPISKFQMRRTIFIFIVDCHFLISDHRRGCGEHA